MLPLRLDAVSVRGNPWRESMKSRGSTWGSALELASGSEVVTLHIMRKASSVDVEQLVTMMAEFYSESPYTLNLQRARAAFTPLLADERLGYVWFIQSNSKDVGYVVVTLCHSMTYGGLSAIVDDFYIRPAFRGAGLGKAAMAEVRSFCAKRGVRAMQVETGRDNVAALAVYRRAGFVETDLAHLTLELADPTHTP
jgi:GNAT superfamily N-acetyltransferase